MSFRHLIPAAALGLALAGSSLGCVVKTNDPPSVSYGTLAVYWTLDGYDDPGACPDYGVDNVDLVVYDSGGFVAAQDVAPCETFNDAIDLPVGDYTVEVTLLDRHGYDVSSTLSQDVRVIANADVVVDVNFPDSGIF